MLFFSARKCCTLKTFEVQIFTVRLFTFTLLLHLMDSDLLLVFPCCFIELLSSLFKYINFTALTLKISILQTKHHFIYSLYTANNIYFIAGVFSKYRFSVHRLNDASIMVNTSLPSKKVRGLIPHGNISV